MADKMLIDAAHPEETRVVVVKGNRVEEFDFESEHKKQIKGNIYLAKVTRVEPSLQAAFVEYGGNRHGFLAFNEIPSRLLSDPPRRPSGVDRTRSRPGRGGRGGEERKPAKPARPSRSRRSRGGEAKAADATDDSVSEVVEGEVARTRRLPRPRPRAAMPSKATPRLRRRGFGHRRRSGGTEG